MMRSNWSSFSWNSSRVGKAINDNWLIGVPSCFSGGRRIVKCTRSTEASDFSMLRQVRSPACGSPETSSTRKFSRTPSTVSTARLLTVVSSPGAASASISTMFGPACSILTGTSTFSPTRTLLVVGAWPWWVTVSFTGAVLAVAVSTTLTSMFCELPTMPKRGALKTCSLRSNSSGLPVSSACTGASKPSAEAEPGTSCTSPSVIAMTPASRSGGTSASAWPRSVNSMVPSRSPSTEVEVECTQRTSRLGTALSLSSSDLRIASVRSVRPAIAWLWLSSTTTATTSFSGSRSSCFKCGLATASRRRAKLSARNTAPRRERQNSNASGTTPSAARPHNTGHGTNGMNSTDQLIASLSQTLEQGRDVHLVGLVVPSQRVHHDVDPCAERHLALHLAARHGWVDRPVRFIQRPGTSEVIGGNHDRAHPVGAARALRPLSLVLGLCLDPQRASVEPAGEAPHKIKGLSEHVVFGHRLERRDVELPDQAG